MPDAAAWAADPGWTRATFGGDATSVAVDARDRVVVFNRGPCPVVVIEGGEIVASWGEGLFTAPHAIALDGHGAAFLVDVGRDAVEKRSLETGELLLRLEPPGGFDRPADVIVHAPSGDVFVADGYGNAHVHRFARDGAHIATWGGHGADPGRFSLPHGIALVGRDRLAVCDRENFRIQLFTLEGGFVAEWPSHRPAAAVYDEARDRLYVAELGPAPDRHDLPGLGHRVAIFTAEGRRAGTFGDPEPGSGPGRFVAPHSLALDSTGAVYVAEVTATWLVGYLGRDRPEAEPPTLQRVVR